MKDHKSKDFVERISACTFSNWKPLLDLKTRYALIICLFLIPSCSWTSSLTEPLPTVPYVDLERYSGLWYEIASYPQRFQRGCHRTTAEYTLSDRGHVVVVNRCNRDSLDGRQSSIRGRAFVQDNSGNAKLRVQFFFPFRGDYWIIDLADDYSYAVVSHPNRNYLWILSRKPHMDQQIYDGIVERLQNMGFDIDRLQLTPQG